MQGLLRRAATASRFLVAQPKRFLRIHEYSAMGLLEKAKIAVPNFRIATNMEEASKAADEIAKLSSSPDFVVKAQVLAGGRGKGVWDSGLRGGVKITYSKDEALDVSKRMLGHRIYTKQTGEAGTVCSAVSIVERKYLHREFYFAIALDRVSAGPIIIASSQGGVNIEQVAEETPEAIIKIPVDIMDGLSMKTAKMLAVDMGFNSTETQKQAADAFVKLYKLFTDTDATLVEINPMAEDNVGKVLCMDCKMTFDDNAEKKQPGIFALRDWSQMDERDVRAANADLNYIGLDGTIGCLGTQVYPFGLE